VVVAAGTAVEERMPRGRHPDYEGYAHATKMLVPYPS
jgi:protein-S-isoprenylcysteine O-methyltransferase Ste14